MSISVPVLAYVRGCVNSIKSESDKLNHKLPNGLRNLKTLRKLRSCQPRLFGLNFEDEGDRWSTFLTVGGVIEIPKNLLFVQKIQAIDGIEWKVEYFNSISFTYLYNF